MVESELPHLDFLPCDYIFLRELLMRESNCSHDIQAVLNTIVNFVSKCLIFCIYQNGHFGMKLRCSVF